MPRLAKAEGALQLEVLLNGKPIGFIGAFWQNAEGQLSAKRMELEGLHLKVPDRFGPLGRGDAPRGQRTEGSPNLRSMSQKAVTGLRDWLGQNGEIFSLAAFGFAAIFGFILQFVLLAYFLVSGPGIKARLFWLVPPIKGSSPFPSGKRLNRFSGAIL